MKCDHCDDIIPKGQGICRTKNRQVGPPSRFGAKTEIIHVTLCPRCADAYDNMGKTMMVIAAIVVFITFFIVAMIR